MSINKIFNDYKYELVLLAPAIILITIFIVVPFIMAVDLSFTNTKLIVGPVKPHFIGLRNYSRILSDDEFWQAFSNTLYFAILVIPIQCSLSLGVALLVNNQDLPFLKFFRSVAFLPMIIPITVVVVIWAAIYKIPDGVLNNFIHMFGYNGYIDWLGSAHWSMPSIVILSTWTSFPFQMMIYLAGLQTIKADLYEAAELDGAKTWTKFRFITFPGLRNTNIVVLIATTIGALKLYTQVDILTHGGPNGSTNTLVRYMVQNGVNMQKIGYSSAVALLFFVFILLLTLLQRIAIKNE